MSFLPQHLTVPAVVTTVGTAALIPLSPALIFGFGPLPRLGIAGGAFALLTFYAVGTAVLAAYVWTGRSVVRPALHGLGLRWPLFWDILRVGLVAALVTIATNLTIAVATAQVGQFGAAGIAGYGTGALMPLVLVPIVGAEPVVPILSLSALFTNTSRVAAFWPLIDRWRALIVLVAAAIAARYLPGKTGGTTDEAIDLDGFTDDLSGELGYSVVAGD